MEEDTIVAIATPRGRGARGIVRLSGGRAVEIAAGCLEGGLGEGTFVREEGRLILAGTGPIDVVVYVMRGPRSYTREDVVELHTWGTPALLGAVVEEVRGRGARLAEAGEFTRRAFLNGRIDLAQAEAVLAVIRAQNDTEERLALSALRGDLSGEVREVRGRLMDLAADVEAGLDFVEEDVSFADERRKREVTAGALLSVEEILKISGERRVYAEEIVTVLYGTVNAGKSSIFNALARREDAIVEDEPGTTRDMLEARVWLGGAEFLLVDTAGVRAPGEVVEEIAVELSHRVARGAQVVLFVVDGSERVTEEVAGLYEKVRGTRHVVLVNKADKGLKVSGQEWRERFGECKVLEVSARTGEGVEGIEEALSEVVHGGGVELSGSRFLLEERQRACIEEARGALERAGGVLEAGEGEELFIFEVREAAEALGRVTGEEYVGGLLDEVFGRFCLGK